MSAGFISVVIYSRFFRRESRVRASVFLSSPSRCVPCDLSRLCFPCLRLRPPPSSPLHVAGVGAAPAAPRRRRPSLVHQRRLRPSVRRLIGPRIDVHVWRRRGSRRRTSSCRARVVSRRGGGGGEGNDKVCFCLKAQLDLFFYIAVSKDLLGHPL